jgi:inhibitor of cysteine peptidase
VRVDESADGQSVDLEAGQLLEVDLPDNPTTGFRWVVTSDGAPACALEGDSYRSPATSRPGQGGRHVWQFRAGPPGQGTIALAYRRPWESDGAERTFTLAIAVR